MSNQLQATGAVKVRSLTGVLVGTSGVVSSLNIDGSLGIPQLDVNGKILVSQLPNSVMEYKGTWDASTNTPTLVNGTGNQGDVYLCNVAGTVNFGAGAIAFFVGDQVIYSGSIWQRASGATGTVTSVAVTETGDSLNITGSPITTSGTINIGFNGTNLQYINGAGNLTTFPALTGYVPYTGATQDVDLDTFKLNAQSLHVKGTGGLGHLGLKHQSANATASANEVSLFADSLGNFSWLNGNLYLSKFITSSNTANRTYTFPNATGTVALTSDFSGYVTGSGSAGRVAFWDGVSNITSDANLYWDSSTDRLGIGSNTPNASLGILNASSTGIQVRTSDSANQYQANIYYDSSFGMVYGYNRLGTGTASNLSFYNSLGGFLSVPESATNNIGFNTLNPQGSSGTSVYDFTSLNTNVEIRLHNSSTGYTSTDGSFIKVTSSALSINHAETSQDIYINNGGNNAFRINGTNKVGIGDFSSITPTEQLSVAGSIQQTGITSTMVKVDSLGKFVAATGGTDYEYPLTFSSPLVRTTNTISIPAATTSVSGYLTSTDWNTFNNKGSGTVTSVSGTAPVVSSGGTTPNISMAAATTSVSGYLTSTDWTTFNNKFTLPALTQGSILFYDGSNIAQNNSKLYWDNTNMRLGIGTQSVSQYVTYIQANTATNANAWVAIDNPNATGSTALRLILNGGTTSGFQYVQSTNMTQVYANAGDIQLINGSSLGLTIANTTGNATFSASISATAITGTGLLYVNAAESNTLYTGAFFWTPGSYNFFNQKTDHSLVIGTYNSNSPIAAITIAQSGTVTFSNSVTATSFVKTGGTSSQFLKADGSVDSTTYGSVTSVATSAPLTGGTITTSGTIGITQATTSANGYLSSTDWNTFNGKFTLPSLTNGSVLFSNGSTIAQDNANFFWDDVNNRLGIGTSAPASILHILGASATLIIDGNSSGTQTNAFLRLRTGGFNVGNFAYNLATDNIQISNVSGGSGGGVQIFGTGGSTTGLTIAAAGAATFSSNVQTSEYFRSNTATTNSITIGVSANTNYNFIGNSNYWGIRTGTAGDFNIDVNNSASPINALKITQAGNVGIGTASPLRNLVVKQSVNSYLGGLAVERSDNLSYLGIFNDGTLWNIAASYNSGGSYQPIGFYTSDVERMRLHTTGKLTITNNYAGDVTFYSSNTSSTGYGAGVQGGNSGNYSFIVRKYDGTDYFEVRGNGGVSMPVVYSSFSTGNVANVYMGAGGSLYVGTSSIKYKKDVINYDKGLAEVLKMRPVYYKGISDYDGDTQFAGLIAEEIQELGLTEFVQYEEDGSPRSLAYASMVTLLIKAIQEQQVQIEELKAKIK
jgi:hypothetical protein